MHSSFIIFTLVAAIFTFATGFKSFAKPARNLIVRHVVEREMPPPRISTLEELVQAFIEAIPSVLKPPKEMDKTKVIEDPPKYLKASSASEFRKSHKGKSHWEKQEEIDNFLSQFFPSEEDKLLLQESLARTRKEKK